MHRIRTVFMSGAALIGPFAAYGAGTPAGTIVASRAEVAFTLGSDALTRSSNVASFDVAEVIDLDLLIQTPRRLVVPGDIHQALHFTLANTGNGLEPFSLTAVNVLTGDLFDPALASPALVFDTDGSGDLSAADVPYVPGANEPVLEADELLGLFLLADIPAGVPDGALGFVRLDVAAATGTGAPGSVHEGAGAGGVDAVLGPSGGARASVGEYLVGQVGLQLAKHATITDPDGGAWPRPGASVAYTIEVTAVGTGTALDAVVEDPVPGMTRYVAGSLRLDGMPLTDAPDLDAGEYVADAAAGGIVVRVGDVAPADPARIIEFVVTIN